MSLDAFEMDFLTRLIAIQSVGGAEENGLPYGAKPFEALKFFLDTANAEGFRTGIINNRSGFAEIGPSDSDKLLGIVCHLDVVPEGSGWDTDPFDLTLKEDGRLYGRGIIDDKGPAACALFAMRRLLKSGYEFKSRVRLILGTDEERTCSCIEDYAKNGEIPTFAITPDAEFPVIYAEKGILNIKVYTNEPSDVSAFAGQAANMVPADSRTVINGREYLGKGVPSHASRPELGVNAIFDMVNKIGEDIKASPLLTYIRDELASKEASVYTGCSIEDESGKITANPSVLRIDETGGSIVIDIRYPVTTKAEDILEYMSGIASTYGLKAEITNHMAPLFKEKDTPEIALLTSVWSKHMGSYDGYKPEYKDLYTEPLAIGGGTYARHMPNTIAFGLQAPWQKDQCHQANESLSVTDLETDIAVLEDAIKGLTELF